MSICQLFLLSSLFSSSIVIKAIYGVFILLLGGLGACLPGAVPCLFQCAVQDYRLTSLQRGLTGQGVNIGVHGIMGIPYLFTCRPVNLSTCLPGLTGQEVNIGVQGIMGISYLSTCRPVNLSTRVDRSRCKHIMSRHYGCSVLVHLSTCQPVYQG